MILSVNMMCNETVCMLSSCLKMWTGSYVGCLQGSLQDGNGVVLGGDIVQVLWTTVWFSSEI